MYVEGHTAIAEVCDVYVVDIQRGTHSSCQRRTPRSTSVTDRVEWQLNSVESEIEFDVMMPMYALKHSTQWHRIPWMNKCNGSVIIATPVVATTTTGRSHSKEFGWMTPALLRAVSIN